MRASKLGSGRKERFEINFFLHVGHSLFPLLRAVMIHSWQNLCKHSLVVIVFFSMSKQMGHISSLCRLRGEIEISVPSVIASWGVRWSSYKLSSKTELDGTILKLIYILFKFHHVCCCCLVIQILSRIQVLLIGILYILHMYKTVRW